MKTVDLPPITQADAEQERDRLFADAPPPPPYPHIVLQTTVLHAGYTFVVTFNDTSLADAVSVLQKRGCEPAGAAPAPAKAQNGHAPMLFEPPTCPQHNRPMKPMKFADKLGNTFMCTAKVGDGWCAERA